MAGPGTDCRDTDSDRLGSLLDAVGRALHEGTPLEILGSGSKRFLGRTPSGKPLVLGRHRGVVSYEPSELVITARAGTPLADIEDLLAGHGQMLAFEPPRLGEGATLGGTVACNLSGPRRPYAGAARDFVLGVRLINGKGEFARFGGEVMKNVAGYDVSRLMAGAMGTLGVLLDVSLKVLPAPETERTIVLESGPADAVGTMNRLAGRPVPLSGAAWEAGRLRLRLSGSEAGVRAAVGEIGGEAMDAEEAREFWSDLRELRLSFFEDADRLWRVSVPPASEPLSLPGDWLIDWGGGQRWLTTELDAGEVRARAAAAGGHATAFLGGDRGGQVFHPLAPGLLDLHRSIKRAMDPKGLFNPGRMYAEL